MLTCFDVADYLLAQTDESSGDLISNLKLQKLVYYAQGVHLAVFDRPLFAEPIEAWTHGPVVPVLYRRYKDSGSGPISPPTDVDFTKFDVDAREILDEVYSVYGQFSAWKLREMTHSEKPWVEANLNTRSNVITHEALAAFFKTQLAA